MATTDTATYFQQLGELVERRWSSKRFDEHALPDIALNALRENPPHLCVSDEDIARWIVSSPSLGPQPNADYGFGEPALTLFAGRRFYIEALYWLDGTTSIHQHAFDGAFCVLGGGSVHSSYEFEPVERLSSRLLLGDVTHRQSEILREGDVRAIRSGAKLIHSLFHYKRPSVTIVVRTHHTIGSHPQFDFDPPYVALAQDDKEVWGRRAINLVDVAIRCDWPSVGQLVRSAMLNAEDHVAYTLMRGVLGKLAELGLSDPSLPSPVRTACDAAVSAAREKFGSAAEALLRSCEYADKYREFRSARERVTDAAQRQFLAVLMNVPSRKQIIELVRARWNDADPEEQICQWLGEMTNGPDALLDYELGADVLRLAKSMMRGETDEQIGRAFASGRAALTPREHEDLREAATMLREIPMFRSLFSDEPHVPYRALRDGTRPARPMAKEAVSTV